MKNESNMTCPMCNQELPINPAKLAPPYEPKTFNPAETVQRLDSAEKHLVKLTAAYEALSDHVRCMAGTLQILKHNEEALFQKVNNLHDWSTNKPSEPYSNA